MRSWNLLEAACGSERQPAAASGNGARPGSSDPAIRKKLAKNVDGSYKIRFGESFEDSAVVSK